MAVKHRHVKVKVYRKTDKYPFYRIAYRAEGRRVVRNFKTYSEARKEAKRIAKQIAKGKESVATLTPKDALAYKFAREKLDELCAHLNAARTDFSTPGVSISLEDALIEFVEAKRMFGPRRLIEAVKGFMSTIARVRRIGIRQAADEYLADRDRLTVPSKPGKRPQLSPKLAYQDRLRLDRFANGFKGDVCDLTKDHINLFFQQHLAELAPRSRNHYRGTLRGWIRFCVARDYLPRDHRLEDATEFSPGGRKKERDETGDIEIHTPDEFTKLLRKVTGELQALLAIAERRSTCMTCCRRSRCSIRTSTCPSNSC